MVNSILKILQTVIHRRGKPTNAKAVHIFLLHENNRHIDGPILVYTVVGVITKIYLLSLVIKSFNFCFFYLVSYINDRSMILLIFNFVSCKDFEISICKHKFCCCGYTSAHDCIMYTQRFVLYVCICFNVYLNNTRSYSHYHSSVSCDGRT